MFRTEDITVQSMLRLFAPVVIAVGLLWGLPAQAGLNEWNWPGMLEELPAQSQPNAEAARVESQRYLEFFFSVDACSPAVILSVEQDAFNPEYWLLLVGVDFDAEWPPDDCVGSTQRHEAQWGFTAACPPPQVFDTTIYGCATASADFTQRANPNGMLCVGNPCDVLSGAKRQQEIDYEHSAGALRFVRTYNSLGNHPAKQGPHGKPLGEAWFGSYLQYLSASTGLDSPVVHAVRPDGDVITFTATVPGSTATQYEAQGELKERLVVVTNASGGFVGWLYVTANDDEELYDSNGRLLAITSRAGVAQTLTYGANDRVASVVDDFGHELTFQWDTASPPRLTNVVLPGAGSGQIVVAYGANNNLTQVTYPDTQTREYLYELTGAGQENLLTGIEDESGIRYVTWGYGVGNVVTSSAYAGGVDSYSITYNTDGTRVVVDPLGTSRTYTTAIIAGQRRYTGSNLLCQKCNQYASATFDAFGNFEGQTDFNGVETRFTHDTARTLETSRTEAYGTPRAQTISSTWHPSYRLPDVITEPGRTTDFDYDSDGNVLEFEVTDTATSVVRRTTWTYDTYGRVLTENGPRTDVTDVTTYTYYTCGTGYECGQLHTVTNALNQVTTFNSYNPHGQPLQITDRNGVVTMLGYDLRQLLTSRTVAGEPTTLEYWPNGLVKKVTLPDLSFVLYTYDNAHRLTRIDDAAGNYISYTLDDMGNRTDEDVYDPTNTLRRTQGRVFNDLNQLWKTLTAAGTVSQTTVFGYDDNGNQTTTNAPMGRNSVNDYDELNRLIEKTDPASGLTHFGYDARDNLTSVTDPRNKVTSYTYNGFDDLMTQTSPDSGLTTHTYDSGGNLKTSTDARSAITTYGYDSLNRVMSAAYKIGNKSDQTILFTYDAGTYGKDRRTGASDADHSMSWVYDALGRVTSKTQTVGSVAKSVGYSYTNGNLTSLTTPSGQAVVYGYSANGQVTSITVNGTTLLSGVSYEPFGPIKGWTWGNGTAMSRTFDTDGKVAAIASAGDKTYLYDDGFRITGITDNLTVANSYTYGYDGLDRLASAVKPSTTRGWTYDANGNRSSETGASPSTFTISSTSNRVTSISGSVSRTYGYDAAGNTLTYSNITATYNNRGRMKTLKKGNQTATFTYNALGELVKRTGGTPGTVHYVYDEAGHLLGEYNTSGALIQETIWLGDTPVATLRPGTPVGIFYVHTDHLNTPRKVTRPSDNQARWTWESDPFGTSLPNENPQSLGTFTYNLRFPGQLYDAHTGLMYNYFRDYDAATGRYIQSDPIGLEGGLNTYAYVDGNPLSRTDALGLDWVYSQSTGQLSHVDATGKTTGIATGYSGIGAGLNNTAYEHVRDVGPIPRGEWTIGAPFRSLNVGPYALPLTPRPGTNPFGRDLFRIHGENGRKPPLSSSNGCPVFDRPIREQIWLSGDRLLRVVP